MGREQLTALDAELDKTPFGAESVWALATGNPAVVDFHIDQLVRSTQFFGWDGFRYDDRYDYDYRGVDLLGRQLPFPGCTRRNSAIIARLRAALEKAKPGIGYGHNMEWSQGLRIEDYEPMPLTSRPADGDYYTEFLRDGGLHLQERWTSSMSPDKRPWSAVAENLFRLGLNARRFGGQSQTRRNGYSFI